MNVNGGYPLELDDFRYLDEIYRTGIHQVAQSLATNAILTGCTIVQEMNQAGTLKLNAGWMIINGEIGYIPPHTGLADTLKYGVVADNTLDNSVIKIMQNGTSLKPREIRQYKLEPYNPAMGVDTLITNIKPMIEVLKSKLGINSNTPEFKWVIDTPYNPFVWNATKQRWEANFPHYQQANIPQKAIAVDVSVLDIGNNTLVDFPLLMDWEIDATNFYIYEYTTQSSDPKWRNLIENNGVKVLFTIVPTL